MMNAITQEFIRLNVVFVVPENIVDTAIALSNKLGGRDDAYFTLGKNQCQPHITLYAPEYPESARNEVLKVVDGVTAHWSTIQCRIVGANSGQGYIGLEVEKTPEIQQLHEECVFRLNPLREGRLREKYAQDYRMQFSDEKIKNIETYGYPNAMSLYHPHLTVIRLKDEQRAPDVAQTIQWTYAFNVTALAVYEMGDHGTCQKLIKEFQLH
ncbi:2'-5' RNA ligase family protein [Candidatus Uhrbacteria bacterium]|nr:2'-5' RNA ligase family protein [Candidatus Uhrbacteria bacterium]